MPEPIPATSPETEPFAVAGGDDMDSSTRARLVEILKLGADLAIRPEVFGDCEDHFVVALRGIKTDIPLADDVKIAYPGSGTHVGVARVFGRENVTHVDPDATACSALTEAGYRAEAVGIENFCPPEPIDGIVALNSYGSPTHEIITKIVKPGGFIIANNYTHWAAELGRIQGLTLHAVLAPAYYAESPQLYRGSDIPTNATGLGICYLKIRDGVVSYGSPDDYTYADETPNYPDALFVFRLDKGIINQ